MKKSTILALAVFVWLLAGAAQATSYPVYAFDENKHAVWIPGLDQKHLLFDDGATLTIEDHAWSLESNLTSKTDGSKWTLSVSFGSVLSGKEFAELTGNDDGRIKGATWADYHDDWAFAEQVTGTLHALTGTYGGSTYSIARYPGSHDYWAQFGTCMNDKNCDKGLSTWLTFKDLQTGAEHRGDINARVAAPVPEPGAALVFGAGLLVVGATTRRRARG